MSKKIAKAPNPRESGRPNPSELRFQDLTVEEMKQHLDDAKDVIVQIETLLATATDRGIANFVVDGATKLARAVELLEDFSVYVYKGLNKAVTQRRRDERGAV